MTTTIEPPVEQTPARIRDKYDEAIEYLTKHPEEIVLAWYERHTSEKQHPAHCLFAMASKTGLSDSGPPTCGCLTQIRGDGRHIAETEFLTAEIKADLSIPSSIDDVTVHHLPIFARWQRRIDQELGRV